MARYLLAPSEMPRFVVWLMLVAVVMRALGLTAFGWAHC
jgi:hypothetical protein